MTPSAQRGLIIETVIRSFACLVALLSPSVSFGQVAPQSYQSALNQCIRTFDELATSDDVWNLETLCELEVEGGGSIGFRVTKWGIAVHRNEFTVSDLMGYVALYAPEGFFLQPTAHPQTFRLGARLPGQDEIVYRHADFGGVYSYAYLIGDRAIWIRCNETLGNCVYYDDLLETTEVTDRWGIARTCSFRWSITFTAPTDDGQIAAHMSTVLAFIGDFKTARKAELVPACLRAGSRQSAE